MEHKWSIATGRSSRYIIKIALLVSGVVDPCHLAPILVNILSIREQIVKFFEFYFGVIVVDTKVIPNTKQFFLRELVEALQRQFHLESVYGSTAVRID